MKTHIVEDRDLATYSQPRISFSQATRASFTWCGELHIVGTCDVKILRAFLVHHACLADLPVYQLDELLDLLAYDELGRWQAVDSLLELKVSLPLELQCATGR